MKAYVSGKGCSAILLGKGLCVRRDHLAQVRSVGGCSVVKSDRATSLTVGPVRDNFDMGTFGSICWTFLKISPTIMLGIYLEKFKSAICSKYTQLQTHPRLSSVSTQHRSTSATIYRIDPCVGRCMNLWSFRAQS